MARYVITPDVALLLARGRTLVPEQHRLLAPTLLRSQVLSLLYRSVRAGEISTTEANALLDHVRALGLRLLGDRVLQREAWRVAERLGWTDTFMAEYVALTLLQADALVTLDEDLARSVASVVTTAPASDVLEQ
jgi:predicted nucleic acid-binding protein